MKRTTSAALLSLLAVSACSSGRAATPALPEPTVSPRPIVATHAPTPVISHQPVVRPRPVAAALTPYGDCTSLLHAIRKEARHEVTAYGLPQVFNGGQYFTGVERVPIAVGAAPMAGGTTGGSTGAAAAPVPAAASAGGATGSGFSGTNNQEADVDEPDGVKTNGSLLMLIQPYTQTLRVFDVSRGKPKQLSRMTIELQGDLQMLLSGSTLVVLGERYENNGPVVTAEVVSIKDPANPQHLRTFRVDGSLLDARFVNGRVVLVAGSAPRITFPFNDPNPAAALATNKALIDQAPTEAWLPSVRVTPHPRTYRAQCSTALHPGVDSGTSTTSIVTLDPTADAPTSNVTIVGGSSVMYASSRALYLATTSQQGQQQLALGKGDGVTTDLHGFDITHPDKPVFLGSGSVPGTLTDQYSLSEDDGYLRVATTLGDPIPPVGEGLLPPKGRLSDNRVTVLKPTSGVLEQVGVVKGLGRGQRIFGVRFLGKVGYVVTFRSIDPLYVIDLSTPTKPTVKGALHIKGYSSALYPLAEGQLLGVGQSVGDHQNPLGAQAEVFDISKLATPTLTGKLVFTAGHSAAEQDHHALLWWAPKHLVVMPLDSYDGRGTSGAAVLRVSDTGALTQLGTIDPPQPHGDSYCCTTSVYRTVVVGDLLYSVTSSGIVTNPLDEVKHQTWLPFH